MNVSPLKKLTIQHLRGSVIPFSLSFEKGKKLTVLYGENGTGKTTICDAFEFLAKGKVGSLEDRGLGKTNQYWHSVGKTPSDMLVTIETDDSTCSAKTHKNEVVAFPPEARPKVEVLRYSQILDLIEARPGDRYTAIRRFIDVSGIEASEASLRDLIRSLNSNRETAVARVQENEDAIRQFWDSAGKPSTDPISWAEQESARDISGIEEALQSLSKLRTAYQRLADYPQKLEDACATLEAAQAAAATSAKRMEIQLETMAEGAGELIDILEAAKSFLEQHPQPAHCPLCESSEKVLGLRETVAERMTQFASLQAAKRDKLLADQAVQAGQRKVQDLQDDASRDSKAFEAARMAHQWEQDMLLPKEPCPTNLKTLAGWLESTCQLPEAWITAESIRREQNQFFGTLKRALETYQTNFKAQKDLDQLLPRLERTLKIVEEERRKFTDNMLRTIADEVGRLYEAVHPGEGLNKISLELDPKKRASLEIGASFAGQTGTPPQAYFSQSHLDTLGLCVFLALASLDGPTDTILVLDDILASVDEPHVERLIEMLYSEANRFRHCVITTHYRPWKQKIRWGWLQNGQCCFIELTKWTTTTGLTTIRSVPDIERLRQLLAETPPDPQLVCSKAGVILEAALDFLTQLYECAVPRRPNGLYTLGDLLPALDKKLRQSLKIEVLTGKDASGAPTYQIISLTPMLNELMRIAQARNIFGCHFNTLSFELLESDAIGFGQQVLQLMELLTDSDTGWPRNPKSGSYWATSGETRRLHPLKQPS